MAVNAHLMRAFLIGDEDRFADVADILGLSVEQAKRLCVESIALEWATGVSSALADVIKGAAVKAAPDKAEHSFVATIVVAADGHVSSVTVRPTASGGTSSGKATGKANGASNGASGKASIRIGGVEYPSAAKALESLGSEWYAKYRTDGAAKCSAVEVLKHYAKANPSVTVERLVDGAWVKL